MKNTDTYTEMVRKKWLLIKDSLDERGRREWAAAEVMALPRGGLVAVHRATGLARVTILKGMRELKERAALPPEEREQPRRVRRCGGGRKKKTESDPTLVPDLEKLLEPSTRGDPESPLRWTTMSLAKLVAALKEMGHQVSTWTVGKILKEMGYSLQGNRKTKEGSSHPDRDAQFQYINELTRTQLDAGQPVISVDTKKKELVGDYKNGGREYRPKGEPRRVKVHDFRGELGRASPYGVYDIGQNTGWVNVGISADTAEFAVQSIRTWWEAMGVQRYPDLTSLHITADGGGSNGHRLRLWKVELQLLADELGVPITVTHFPPGTSKWNKIEHKLFSFIAMNWRGQPLVDYQTIVNLISSTTTKSGLVVQSVLDERQYEKGRKITKAEMAEVDLHRHDFHGDWNYTIKPRNQSQ